jgi:predicted DNA-binding transcriptional regulator AlpA
MNQPDFIAASELSQLTGLAINTLYTQHARKRGPLAGILCKLGNRRLGCWRADYDLWVASQRRLKSPTEQRSAA